MNSNHLLVEFRNELHKLKSKEHHLSPSASTAPPIICSAFRVITKKRVRTAITDLKIGHVPPPMIIVGIEVPARRPIQVVLKKTEHLFVFDEQRNVALIDSHEAWEKYRGQFDISDDHPVEMTVVSHVEFRWVMSQVGSLQKRLSYHNW